MKSYNVMKRIERERKIEEKKNVVEREKKSTKKQFGNASIYKEMTRVLKRLSIFFNMYHFVTVAKKKKLYWYYDPALHSN